MVLGCSQIIYDALHVLISAHLVAGSLRTTQYAVIANCTFDAFNCWIHEIKAELARFHELHVNTTVLLLLLHNLLACVIRHTLRI